MVFKDRVQAGQKMAEVLKKYQGQDAIIYALPRGGVVIGAEIAKKLNLCLDAVIIRKIGHPNQPEYAIAATSENAHMVINEEEVAKVDKAWFYQEAGRQREEARRRRKLYLAGKTSRLCLGKIAILVDDGIATGLTIEAAILETKHQNPKKIVVAAPIIPQDIAQNLRLKVDEVIALDEPTDFLGSVGAYYKNFPQVTDEEVIGLMSQYGSK